MLCPFFLFYIFLIVKKNGFGRPPGYQIWIFIFLHAYCIIRMQKNKKSICSQFARNKRFCVKFDVGYSKESRCPMLKISLPVAMIFVAHCDKFRCPSLCISVARGFLRRCPSFFTPLPVFFHADGREKSRRRPSLWAYLAKRTSIPGSSLASRLSERMRFFTWPVINSGML